MSWFDDAALEADTLHRRAESIEQGAEQIYNVLWGAIVRELPNSKIEILPGHGTTFERTLAHQALPALHAESRTIRTMHIRLSSDKTLITAKAPKLGQYLASAVEFQLRPDDHGALRLMHERELIEIRSAAIMVLRNFLFPEIPLKGTPSQQHII